ncbi:hypothetical protein [Novosphingobium sp.]|uniref:hypothetical protein n=1 Tax=Novosphingobium sp. TaxID=1874826 RepID=UPI00352AA832
MHGRGFLRKVAPVSVGRYVRQEPEAPSRFDVTRQRGAFLMRKPIFTTLTAAAAAIALSACSEKTQDNAQEAATSAGNDIAAAASDMSATASEGAESVRNAADEAINKADAAADKAGAEADKAGVKAADALNKAGDKAKEEAAKLKAKAENSN